MAGGGGTRFWPISRKDTPKQLLNLSGKDIMVNEAIDRLARIADYKNIFVVTNAAQKDKLLSLLNGRLTEDRVLAEAAARNTAACIGYAAAEILEKYGDGIMVITPSDAYIRNEEVFAEVLKNAVAAAEETDKLVTVGITSVYPATGYGYIQYKQSEKSAKEVLRFVEKPDRETAEKYLNSGDFVWNSGMFVWRASTILDKFRIYLPEVYACLEQISNAFGADDEKERIARIYPTIPSVSVDYGIMEKCDDILVVPAEFGWSDVGSLDAFHVLHGEDKNGNIFVGDTVALDTSNSTLYSGGRLVAAIGVEDLIVVETPDAVLVCKKDRAQDVKRIVDELRSKGKEELL